MPTFPSLIVLIETFPAKGVNKMPDNSLNNAALYQVVATSFEDAVAAIRDAPKTLLTSNVFGISVLGIDAFLKLPALVPITGIYLIFATFAFFWSIVSASRKAGHASLVAAELEKQNAAVPGLYTGHPSVVRWSLYPTALLSAVLSWSWLLLLLEPKFYTLTTITVQDVYSLIANNWVWLVPILIVYFAFAHFVAQTEPVKAGGKAFLAPNLTKSRKKRLVDTASAS
jgi:hypothetical protein